jgi:thiamine-monophosphate kinase
MTRARRLPGSPLALGPGPEFDRIRSIIAVLGPQARGLGDDCGLVQQEDGFLALSTDISVEGVHFRFDWITSKEVGWRATSAALSDLAAEAADPIGVLCAVTMPVTSPESQLLEVMAGIRDATAAVQAQVLGGDLSSGPVWSVAVTVVGWSPQPITRSGAKPGDGLWVTGRLGGARAALHAWLHGREPQAGARSRFAHPQPRIAAGRWLAQHGATAMIDLSDGLAGDARHLAAASGLAMRIDLDALPLAEQVKNEALTLRVPDAQFAAEGGEDYELLVSLPESFVAADAFARDCGIPLTRIGDAAPGSGVEFILAGRSIDLSGFSHFG